MADQPSPRRRFQFRLSSLFIVVTLVAAVCAVVAWTTNQVSMVRERRQLFENAAARSLIHEVAAYTGDQPWMRRWLRDRTFDRIVLNDSAGPDEIRHFQRAFPEAQVVRVSESK